MKVKKTTVQDYDLNESSEPQKINGAAVILRKANGTEIVVRDNLSDQIIPADILFRDDYIATKLWCRDDIASQMSEMGIEPTTARINEVLNTGILGCLGECTDGDWEDISCAINAADAGNLPVNKLDDIVMDNEKIVNMSLVGSYATYRFIKPDPESDDIAAALEYTLHRMKEFGFTDEQILSETGMHPEEEDDEIAVDLGYYMPQIQNIWEN